MAINRKQAEKTANIFGIAFVIAGTVIGVLIALMGLANAATCPDGVEDVPASWVAATERADKKNTPFKDSENGGYKIYSGTKSGDYPDSVRITDKKTLSTTIPLCKKQKHYLVITQWDTEGQESAHSKVVVKDLRVEVPAAPESIAMTRVGRTLDYSFEFPVVTTYADGTKLPDGAVTKYFLFINGVWKQDVYEGIPVVRTMDIGEYVVTMETEIKTDGKNVSSAQSEPFTLIVDAYVEPPVVIEPPKPPTIITVPKEGVTITFIPE